MIRARTYDVIGLDHRQQWERDRQIVLAQLHNLMLALRSNTKFSSRMRFVQAAMEPQHRLMTLVKGLREALFSPQMDEISEDDILTPFCEVALSEETTEPITGVALAAFVTFLDLKCGFLSTKSLVRLSDCASNSKSEIADAQSHEAVLARILQVYVGCARHPVAQGLSEAHVVGMLERAYAVSTHGDPSELLRRTAEQAMNDIVTAVFYRIVEECDQDAGSDDEQSPTGGAAAGDVEVDGNIQGSKQICSGALIIQYICKLIMCNVRLPQAPPGQSAVSVAAVQLQGLCLAHTALFILKDSLRLPRCRPLLRFVRNDLCRALLTIGSRTENIIVLSQLLRTAHLVVQFASVAVVPQALSIIKGIHLTPMTAQVTGTAADAAAAGSPSSGKLSASRTTPVSSFAAPAGGAMLTLDDIELRETHEMLIESILEFCSDHSFATFCFVHYDLSLHYPALLEQLCMFLSRGCFHTNHTVGHSPMTLSPTTQSAPGSGNVIPTAADIAGGSAGGSPQSSASAACAHLNQINILAFDSLMAMLLAIFERAQHHRHHQMDKAAAEHASKIRDAIQAKLSHKAHIMKFAEKFSAEPLKCGVAYFLETSANRDSITGWEVGEFLYEHRAILDKTVLGEYLGDLGKEPVKPDSADTEAVLAWEADRVDDHRKPGTVRFFERQLRGFLHGFNFYNKELLQSIREMVFQMRLPGEAQKIDRVMQAFAEHWYACNKNSENRVTICPFQSEDAAFILSFSIIMLNTDLHSGKLDKTMTQEQFRSMNRGIDNGQNVPDEYLNNVYDAVRAEQIIMIDMVRQGHEFDAVWKMEMAEARQQAHDSLLAIGMRGNTAPDLHPFDPFVFNVLWRPALVGLASVFEGCGNLFVVDRSVQTLDQLSYHIKKRWSKDFAVFSCAQRGLQMIVELAFTFGTRDAVDHVLLVLLRHCPLSLQDGYSNLQMLGRSASTLFSISLIFDVLFKYSRCVTTLWRELCSFLHKAFLLGMFAIPQSTASPASMAAMGGTTPPPSGLLDDSLSSASAARTYSDIVRDDSAFLASACEELLSPVLRSNPGLVGSQAASLAEGSSGGWFGGWFASQAATETKRKEREQDDLAALKRIRSAVPDIASVLDVSKAMVDEDFRSFVSGLCDSHCNDCSTPASGFTASYSLHLTLEVVFWNLRRIELVESTVLGHVETLLRPATNRYEKAHQAAEATPATDKAAATRAVATADHWRSVASRMIDAVLRLVMGLSRTPRHHNAMMHVLSILTSLPRLALTSVVAQPLSVTLYTIVVERAATDGGVFITDANTWNQLLHTVHVVGVVAPYVEVRSRMLATALCIVRQGTYDVNQNTYRVGHCILGIIFAEPITTQELPQDWVSVTSFDTTPYVTLQTPLRTVGRDLKLKDLEEKVPEALVAAYKRLVGLCRDGDPWSGPQGAAWSDAWMFLLSGLVSLVVSARQPRVSSDALLCLQRCVLDTDLLSLPLPFVLDLFQRLVFPLTEKLCATATQIHGSGGGADSSVTPSKGSSATPGPLSLLSPSVLIATVFGPLAGPSTTSGGHSSPPSIPLASSNGGSATAQIPTASTVNEDMQCRALSLLPKTFLHYLYILASSGSTPAASPSSPASQDTAKNVGVLEDVWKRMIGTLYALYTLQAGGSHHHRGAASRAAAEETSAMLKEAIQENVKNLVFVMAATVQVPEQRLLLEHYPNFWVLTAELIKGFDFGESLVQHLVASKLLPLASCR